MHVYIFPPSRELLWTLSKEELWMLEKSLCSTEEQTLINSQNALITYPDDFDPYENLIIDPSDTNLDGAIGPPSLDLDEVLGLTSDCGRTLGVEPEDYGCMSQSPSTMTLVAQAEHQCNSDGDADGNSSETSDCLRKPKSNMKHQDSSDSGMLSENGSILNSGNTIPMVFENASGESRSLRHSLSWPEPTRRMRHRRHRADRRSSVVDFLDDNFDTVEGPQPSCTHQSSHDFNFHLPLNTEPVETGLSRAWDQTPTNAVDLGSTRVFYTSDCLDSPPDTRNTQQISFVTETLNEVFVTDTSFQTSFISAVTSKALTESMGICCKCGNKTCAVTESSGRDSSAQEDSKQDHYVDHLNEFNMFHGEQTSSSSNGQRDHGHTSNRCWDQRLERDHISASVSDPTAPAEPSTIEVIDSPESPDSEVEKDNLELSEKGHTCKKPEIMSESSDNTVSGTGHDGPQNACDRHPCPNVCDCASQGVSGSSNTREGRAGTNASTPLGVNRPQTTRSEQMTSGESRQGNLAVPRIPRFRYTDGVNMMCSACNRKGRSRSPSVASTDVDWDRER